MRRASVVLVLTLVALFGMLATFVSYVTIPSGNTTLTRFDTIIVLGTPSLPDGSPSPDQRMRVSEGVREYRAGVAPHIIMTGGAAHNQFVEAHTMVEIARGEGVPGDALVEEGRAQNTIQNIFYSEVLMKAHGWSSAEVVSSPSHLPRAALILEHHSFAWRTHAAVWPRQFANGRITLAYLFEAAYCAKLRWIGFRASPFLPR